MNYPKGFFAFGRNIGIKDKTLDFAVLYSQVPCEASAVFTLNNFPGAPIIVGKENIQNGKLQAIVVNSKNSNVATGIEGIEVARETCRRLAKSLGIEAENILPSSTGIIGVPLPKEKIYNACEEAREYLKEGNLEEFGQAIMTTDKKEKISKRNFSKNPGMIYGVAKGAGMIEPNMATMLSYIVTDVLPETGDLKTILLSAVNKSFNCLTIDSDTSTSDTVVLLCNGLSGKVSEEEFSSKLLEVCLELTKKIASDGEGVTKLIELKISSARDEVQAKKIGKSVLNSPLVKTAIYGGDPNWGRFVMAIGKVFDEPISFQALSIKIGNLEMKQATKERVVEMSNYLKSNSEIQIEISLGAGSIEKVFWGCDLSEGYIAENAYYST
ncbi:MAG: bifunctional glutamate N-acetyltransferase/amino-acid acetyltransferase ArgJ [Leptospiraceae bacterium]|nr:bifunctional glutamate N-acetyltransferase/amino-acid acetyltransferase ArgJ [Leptospiraceae bacterium]